MAVQYNSDFTGQHNDDYDSRIKVLENKIAELESLTTGVGFTGTWNINAATSDRLSNTPNNANTFLRGDNTWSNTLTGTLQAERINTNLMYSTNGTRHFRQVPEGIVYTGYPLVGASGTLTVNHSDTEWLKCLLKALCDSYPGERGLFRGAIAPNSQLVYEVWIYSTSTRSSAGLPQYSFGTYSHWFLGMGIFGTNEYNFSLATK